MVLLNLLLLLVVAAFVPLVIRFRRSRGEERQQLKWFTYAGALVPLVALGDVLPVAVSNLFLAAVFALLPVAAGIAILRYRLYDIDRLINRTLVYGSLTPCSPVSTAGWFWCSGRCSEGSAPSRQAGWWPARPWRWPRCSNRPAAASRR